MILNGNLKVNVYRDGLKDCRSCFEWRQVFDKNNSFLLEIRTEPVGSLLWNLDPLCSSWPNAVFVVMSRVSKKSHYKRGSFSSNKLVSKKTYVKLCTTREESSSFSCRLIVRELSMPGAESFNWQSWGRNWHEIKESLGSCLMVIIRFSEFKSIIHLFCCQMKRKSHKRRVKTFAWLGC